MYNIMVRRIWYKQTYGSLFHSVLVLETRISTPNIQRESKEEKKNWIGDLSKTPVPT
jgi:hypothetical protein